jgi:AraC-like DNA-binding protein
MSAFEKHYTVQELAEKWGMSESTIRRLFEDERGVLKLGNQRHGTRKRDSCSAYQRACS